MAVALLLATGCGSGAVATVQFTTRDGFTLVGEELGSGPKGVVLVHEESNDRTAWRPFARTLAGENYHVLVFDLRGHGASGGPRSPARAHRDVSAAVDYLRRRGASGVVVAGAGAGAGAALEVASAVSGVVLISPPREEPENPPPMLPSLVMTGSGAQEAAAAAIFRVLPQPSEIQVYPTSRTGIALIQDSGAARDDLMAFLKRVLG